MWVGTRILENFEESCLCVKSVRANRDMLRTLSDRTWSISQNLVVSGLSLQQQMSTGALSGHKS